jgi:hypothetical protein
MDTAAVEAPSGPGRSRRIPPETKLLLAVLAGGRCELRGCNKYLFEHPITLAGLNLTENAHIYPFSDRGPRGNGMRPTDIHAVENLMLLCGDCHKEIDKNKAAYPIEVLEEHKREHEERIRYVTGFEARSRTSVIVLKSRIGGRVADVSFDEVREAVAPRYPNDRQGYVIDLSELGDETCADYYTAASRRIRQKMQAFYERGVDGQGPAHVSAFGIAVIPLLMQFGRSLSDKVGVDLFQRHHGGEAPWRWRSEGAPARFELRSIRQGTDSSKVGTLLSLSGVVDRAALPAEIDERYHLYEIILTSEVPNRSFLRRCEDLAEFRREYEKFLSGLVASHPGLAELHVFPAVPAPVAIMCGHVLLPKVHPALVVYDHDKARGGFIRRLTINDHDE